MEQWEYFVTFLEADAKKFADQIQKRFANTQFVEYSPVALIPQLDEFGAKGWELMSMQPVAQGSRGDIQIHPATTAAGMGQKIWSYTYLCVFKRPKKQSPPPPTRPS